MQPVINMQPNGVGTVHFGQPDQVNVTFYSKQVSDKALTAQSGVPQYKSVDYVRIQHPGERDYTDNPVTDRPIVTSMYSRQWAAYQQAKEYVPDGTPIEMLFPQSAEMPIAGTLRSLGIHTVQQLANLTVEGMHRIGMGAQDYVTHAKKYLDTASGGAGYHKLQKDIAERDNKIEVLENNMRLLQGQVELLLAQQRGQAQHTLLSGHAQASVATQAAGTVLPNLAAMQGQGIGSFAGQNYTAQQPIQRAPLAMQPLPAPMWSTAPGAVQAAPVVAQTEPVAAAEPKRKGWPLGKPRKPQTPTQE